jgi:GNAT superfamily N-acetyltransferase
VAVTIGGSFDADLAARARAWTRVNRAALCDVVQPWEHGTVLRCTRYPRWYDLNLVRVEEDPGATVEQLIAFADRALAPLEHRMISFEVSEAADPLRSGFEAAGWRTTRLVWMHHEGSRPAPDGKHVTEVPYDAVDKLRLAWHYEDFPNLDPGDFHSHMREVALQRGTRVLAMLEDDEPVGFAALDAADEGIEIGAVYVLPDHRGGGRGTALTRAAIAAAGDVENVWICADADDRPQHLYARLGFRTVYATVDYLQLPRG